jgi:hypothetical protein
MTLRYSSCDSGCGGVWLFLDEKDAWLLAVTVEERRAKFWEVRWREGKWTKRLMGKVPELCSEIGFVRAGQSWIVAGFSSKPEWQEWLWWEIEQHLQRFFPFPAQNHKTGFLSMAGTGSEGGLCWGDGDGTNF